MGGSNIQPVFKTYNSHYLFFLCNLCEFNVEPFVYLRKVNEYRKVVKTNRREMSSLGWLGSEE